MDTKVLGSLMVQVVHKSFSVLFNSLLLLVLPRLSIN